MLLTAAVTGWVTLWLLLESLVDPEWTLFFIAGFTGVFTVLALKSVFFRE